MTPFAAWPLIFVTATLGFLFLIAHRSGRAPSTGRAPSAGSRSRRRYALEIALISLAGGAGVAYVTWAITNVPALGAVVGVAAGGVPSTVTGLVRKKRAAELRKAWPDAVDHLIASIRGGDSLPAAVATTAESGPPPLRPHLGSVVAEYRATGDFSQAVERLGERLGDDVTRHVVPALVMAHQIGGRELVRLLKALATFTRDDDAVRQEVAARQSWTVSGARAAAAAPWVILLLFSTRPTAMAAFRSPPGNALIAAGAVTTFAGYRCMLALGRLPHERGS